MNLGERVKRILATPKTEWPIIANEPATMQQIFRDYAVPLAAIPAVAGFIGGSVLGMSMMGMHYRVGIVPGIVTALVSFGLSLAGVYIIAMVVDALAPTFASRRSSVAATKIAAYSHTASWVAGIFLAIPGLRFLSILGLYGFYLFYTGLGPVMGTPEDKRLPYTLAVVVAALIVFFIVGTLVRALVPFG
jgi:hypothetical protein